MEQYEALARAATDSYMNNLPAEAKPVNAESYIEQYMNIYRVALNFAVSLGDLSQEAYNQHLYDSQNQERYL